MARPEMVGNVIRRIDLNCTRGNSNKDYRITITDAGSAGCFVYSEYGPAGSLRNGQCLGENLGISAAEKIAGDLRLSKEKKGYVLVWDKVFETYYSIQQRSHPPVNPPEIKTPRPLKSITDVSVIPSEIKTLLF